MLNKLSPSHLWGYFEQITQVPRRSKHEEKILEYLKNFARENGQSFVQDSVGNIVIYAPATAGYENSEPVILQSHVDMVCEKNSDVEFDFDNDPLKIYIEDGYVKAHGTTLGADCGIGMATALALLSDKTIERPALEALFTVDEETGLSGADGLDFSMLHSKRLINLDSEDDGELFVGCAGGKDTVGRFDLEYRPSPRGVVAINIAISGLKGGHSGDDINKQRANAVVLLCRFLFENFNNFNMNLSHIDAGGLRNAIAREANAFITIQKSTLPYFEEYFAKFVADVKNEYRVSEPDMNIRYDIADVVPNQIVERSLFLAVITSVYTMPCGVMAFSQDLPGFVESSTNVASIKIKDEFIEVTTSQRSSLDSKKEYIANIVMEIFEGCGAEVEQSKGYPGWSPNAESALLESFKSSYRNMFKDDIKVKVVHAGLECGLFLEKSPRLDMVSVGPTIRNAHSPLEMLEISTVEKFWNLMVDVLKNMR